MTRTSLWRRPAIAALLGVALTASMLRSFPALAHGGHEPAAGGTSAPALNQPVAGMAATPSGRGYWLVAADGGVFAFGDAVFHGSTGAIRLNRPIVGMAPTPSGRGYWLVASDGGIFSFGDARFYGSAGGMRLNRPVVGMAPTPSGRGYWLVASDGGIFAYGDAVFRGSTGGIALNQAVVGMRSTPSGAGYWLVASDGGIFAFGDARFHGSTGAIRLARPIVGMAAAPTGRGYWLVASDGGIFAFGDAPFRGSTGGQRLDGAIVGMAPTPQGQGYWLAGADGAVFPFGDATPAGSAAAATAAGAFGFMATNADGSAVRFNPCQTLRFVTNLSRAPAGALAEVQSAFSRLTAVTGIQFQYDGDVSELPARSRPPYQPARYGQRWAPILVAWANPGDTDFLSPGAIGEGGSTYISVSGGQKSYVTGQVVINASTPLPPGFVPGGRGVLVLHELGHVLGLAHVQDRSQVMNPTLIPTSPTDYESGDRAGLRLLGAAQGCLPVPLPQPVSFAGETRGSVTHV